MIHLSNSFFFDIIANIWCSRNYVIRIVSNFFTRLVRIFFSLRTIKTTWSSSVTSSCKCHVFLASTATRGGERVEHAKQPPTTTECKTLTKLVDNPIFSALLHRQHRQNIGYFPSFPFLLPAKCSASKMFLPSFHPLFPSTGTLYCHPSLPFSAALPALVRLFFSFSDCYNREKALHTSTAHWKHPERPIRNTKHLVVGLHQVLHSFVWRLNRHCDAGKDFQLGNRTACC